MRVSGRNDGWHSDGGASLLHAGLTLGGRRLLEMDHLSAASTLERAASAPREFLQTPGSFYIGNTCAIRHNVKHYGPEAQDGLFESTAHDEKTPDGHVLAVMIRSSCFRKARGHNKDATPGPAELFHVVNEVVRSIWPRILCSSPTSPP